MKSNKGQALVEFVIILPVMLMLIFSIVDFGRVLSLKSNLENISSDVVGLYENGKTPDEINIIINKDKKDKIDVLVDVNENYTKITLNSKIKPITPGFNKIQKKVFDIKTVRTISNE